MAAAEPARSTGLRILITNNTLDARAGSELYVRDLAISLMKRGHFPVAYSPCCGSVAEELANATIPVVDDLRSLAAVPDIIHGQHHFETMTAALRFPTVPVVFVCHGWLPWEERPPVFPTILRYVAVDDLCRERLLTTGGIAADRVSVIRNFVDLDRFAVRQEWPKSPKRALIFSNYAASDDHRTRAIRTACLRCGIEQLDVIGGESGNGVSRPEQHLHNYDVVFAKGRSALESMASGAAVIVADFAGLGGMVTTSNVEPMRKLNFGARTMQAAAVTEENVLRELQRYDADETRQVSAWVREDADMSKAVDSWLLVYEDMRSPSALTGLSGNVSALHANLVAGSNYLRWLSPIIKSRHEAEQKIHEANQARKELSEALVQQKAQFENELVEGLMAAVKTSAVRRESD